MHLFSIFQSMFLVFIIARSTYASASHQVPVNQKSIELLLFRKYTHCYQHSTKGRLNHGLQSFETCIYNNHFDTHETPHHDTIFIHRIDRLPYRYVSQIPSLCLCHICARTFVYICTQVTRVCQDIPHHMSGTFSKH